MILEICDLAVTNVLAEEFTPKVGDIVKFVVNLYNQGNQPATDVSIGYKIPEGFTYLPVNDDSTPSWTIVNDSLATVTLSTGEALTAGEQDSICIFLLLENVAGSDEDSWTTIAEIQSFADESGVVKTCLLYTSPSPRDRG